MAQAEAVGLTIAHQGPNVADRLFSAWFCYTIMVAFNRLRDCKICKVVILFVLL